MEQIMKQIAARNQVLDRLMECIIEALNISYPKDVIHPDVPLFGSGLGLDSIDALEVVMAVENEFGISFPESDVESMRTFNTMADKIIELQTA